VPQYEITNKRQATLYTPVIAAANRYCACAEIPIKHEPLLSGGLIHDSAGRAEHAHCAGEREEAGEAEPRAGARGS